MYNIRKLEKRLDYIENKLDANTRRTKTFLNRVNAYRELLGYEIEALEKERERLIKKLPQNLYPYSRVPAVAVYLEDKDGYLPITDVGSPYKIQKMKENV